MAVPGIFDNTVSHTVKCVAGIQYGSMDERELRWRNKASFVFMLRLRDPYSSEYQVRPIVRGCARDDAIVVGRIALHLLESLPAA